MCACRASPLDLMQRLSTSIDTVDMFSLSPRVSFRRLVSPAWFVFGLAACESTDDPKNPTVAGDAVLETANNYTSILDLAVGNFDFDPAAAVTVDWSLVAAGTNMRTQPTQPIELVIVAKATGDHAAVEQAIEAGTVNGLMAQQFTATPTSSSALLTDIVRLPDYFSATNTSYILSFATGRTSGEGIQALTFITPVPGATTTLIQPPPGSQQLVSFTPTFGAPLVVPTSDPGSIGWGAVDADSQGQLLTAAHRRDVNRVLLAYFQGKQSSELQNQDTFLTLETSATTLYQADIAHAGADPTTAIELSLLVNRADNTPFTRFTQGGTWIFAAMCDTCNNPALILSLLTPIGE